jgi:hypothetical protein
MTPQGRFNVEMLVLLVLFVWVLFIPTTKEIK